MTERKSRAHLTELVERCSFLREIDLFDELTRRDLVEIAELAVTETAYAGEPLFEQGDPGDALYIVRSGMISIRIDGREVNRCGAGEALGEIALIDGLPRSASCIVVEDATLLRIGADDFGLLLAIQPDTSFCNCI